MAVRRMIQAGVTPITWQAVLGEWQRDCAREETIPAVIEVQAQHGGGRRWPTPGRPSSSRGAGGAAPEPGVGRPRGVGR